MSKKVKPKRQLSQTTVDNLCAPPFEQGLHTLEAVVDDYISNYRRRAEKEISFY